MVSVSPGAAGGAPVGAVPAISAESDDLRFWPVDQLPASCDDGVRAALVAALHG